MIRIAILGDIGSGKSYVSNKFGYPVFNADNEVSKIYKFNKNIFKELNKIFPKDITSFPINKKEISNVILIKPVNLKKIIRIIHKEVRKKLIIFLKKNKLKKIVILDIPLLLENKLNNKKDILIFIDAKKNKITKNLKKRPNFNAKIIKKFRDLQLPVSFKKKKAHYIIKNNFTSKSVNDGVNKVLKNIL
tara:strand:- start:1546 stop:2115 length:570 start_codon:yes stop_codon:yes gene_type:complete